MIHKFDWMARHQPALFIKPLLFWGVLTALSAVGAATVNPADIDLEKTISLALEANLSSQISSERTRAAEAAVKGRRTEFFPTFSTSYRYQRTDQSRIGFQPGGGLVQPKEQYTWVTSVTQPLFTGFALTHQYQLAQVGLDMARFDQALIRQDIIFEAKRVYFLLLKAEKLKMVAEEAVTMLEAQTEVAANFHQVGMTALNDLLKTKVELANARQDLVAAQNNLALARVDLNLLLRRPIGNQLDPLDILDFVPVAESLAACLETAEKYRLEVVVADLEIQVREKEVALSRKDYFPTLQVQGNYYRQGTDWELAGIEGINDSGFWDIQAQARWDFWQWGKTGHDVAEKKSRLTEARLQRSQLLDTIQRQVQQAWLKADEFEKNIVTVQSAIDQARESFRISEALFREQMATASDVLDARTQLSETITRYYQALYDFQIAVAALDRAMGKPRFEMVEAQ